MGHEGVLVRCDSCGAQAFEDPCPECGAAIPRRRIRWVAVGAFAAAFLLGVAVSGVFLLGSREQDPAAAIAASRGVTATVTATETETATATRTTTATLTSSTTAKVTVTSTPSQPTQTPAKAAPASTPPPPARPRGTLLVQAGPEGGFGQSFPDGRCAVWRTGFVNQSDTAIDQITMAPPGGDYSGEWNGHDFDTRAAAKPAPAVLNVYIAPGERSAFEYKTCTSTPVPGPKFEYGALAPKYLEFRWETGQSGRACFKC